MERRNMYLKLAAGNDLHKIKKVSFPSGNPIRSVRRIRK